IGARPDPRTAAPSDCYRWHRALLESSTGGVVCGSETIRRVAGKVRQPCGAKGHELLASPAGAGGFELGQKHRTDRQTKNNSCSRSVLSYFHAHFAALHAGPRSSAGLSSTPNWIEPTAPATL